MKIETVEIIIWILASKRIQPKTCVHLHFILQDKQRKQISLSSTEQNYSQLNFNINILKQYQCEKTTNKRYTVGVISNKLKYDLIKIIHQMEWKDKEAQQYQQVTNMEKNIKRQKLKMPP